MVAASKPVSIDDVLLGYAGRTIPPSSGIDHAVRYFGSWSGSDKLLMATQYTAKLSTFYLNWRAAREFAAGRRAKPISPAVDALMKFAALLSMTRRLSGLWGFLGILKGMSALERNRPKSQTQLTLQRIQGLSMLVFYPLEFISFFSAPWAPVLTAAKIITPQQGAKAALWSVRAWGVYVLVQVLLLRREWNAIAATEKKSATSATAPSYFASSAGAPAGASIPGTPAVNGSDEKQMLTSVVDEERLKHLELEKEKTKKRKVQLAHQLLANTSRLPVIAHWSIEGGVYPYEILTSFLSLVSALAAFHGGWVNTRLPAPQR